MSGGKCNQKDVMKYLREENFPVIEAEALGHALKTVPLNRIQDALVNRGVSGSFNSALIAIIQYWLHNEPKPEWKMVAKALEDTGSAEVARKVLKWEGKPCTLKEILGALLKSGFSASDCDSLGLELDVPKPKVQSIMAEKGVAKNARMALNDIVGAWFDNEPNPTLDKVKKAVDEVTQAKSKMVFDEIESEEEAAEEDKKDPQKKPRLMQEKELSCDD